MTLKEFQTKIEKDYEELVAKGNKDWALFLNRAYEYAHYNEIYDYFMNLDVEYDWTDGGWEETIGEIKDVNIIDGIYQSWLNYNHPERFNFFCYEDLIDIIKYYFTHLYNKEA